MCNIPAHAGAPPTSLHTRVLPHFWSSFFLHTRGRQEPKPLGWIALLIYSYTFRLDEVTQILHIYVLYVSFSYALRSV